MIGFNRTAAIAPGKTANAIKFSHLAAAYVKSTNGVDLKVLSSIGGNPQHIVWSICYVGLAALDHVSAKALEDKLYWKMVGKSTDNFLPRSVRASL